MDNFYSNIPINKCKDVEKIATEIYKDFSIDDIGCIVTNLGDLEDLINIELICILYPQINSYELKKHRESIIITEKLGLEKKVKACNILLHYLHSPKLETKLAVFDAFTKIYNTNFLNSLYLFIASDKNIELVNLIEKSILYKLAKEKSNKFNYIIEKAFLTQVGLQNSFVNKEKLDTIISTLPLYNNIDYILSNNASVNPILEAIPLL